MRKLRLPHSQARVTDRGRSQSLPQHRQLASMAFVQQCAVGSVASADVARGSAAKCVGRALGIRLKAQV